MSLCAKTGAQIAQSRAMTLPVAQISRTAAYTGPLAHSAHRLASKAQPQHHPSAMISIAGQG